MKDHLIARTRSTSDLPSSNNGIFKIKFCINILSPLLFKKYVIKYHLFIFRVFFLYLVLIFLGDLGHRIDARLHDLSQLQLENGKRTHVSRANIPKSNR